MNRDLKDMDVLILCGGLGKRLRGIIDDRPKSMAEIHSRPFLDLLLDYVSCYGLHRFILCTGYMADIVKKYYRNIKRSYEILFSHESYQLGTAGAVLNAKKVIKSNPFIVMNGDSICRFDLIEFVDFHIHKGAIASLALVNSDIKEDFGVVNLDNNHQIIGFYEKAGFNNPGNFINAGVYIFDKEVLSLIPESKYFSLEYDLFPMLKKCYGYVTGETLIDIGTPEGYKKAEQIFESDLKD